MTGRYGGEGRKLEGESVGMLVVDKVDVEVLHKVFLDLQEKSEGEWEHMK